MKQFLSFVQKEFYHIFRDRRTMLILLGMPVVQIILFGFAITTEVKNIRVAVLDPSRDEITQKLIEKIDANEYLNIVSRLQTQADIESVFKKGDADLVIVFSDHFGDNLNHTQEAPIQLIADGTDPNVATTIVGYITNIANSAWQEMKAAPGYPPYTVVPQVKLLYNPGMESAYNFVPGVMGLILMLICAMMTSISIVREKETGTMEVLLVSPVKPVFIIFAKVMPYLALSCLNLASILLLSVYVLDVPVAGSLFWLSVISFLFILVSLSLGILISTIAQTQVAAMLASGLVLMMPVILLSGMIFPIESMPVVLQGISNIIPARWYIAAIRKIMIEGLDVVFVWKEIIILSAMALFLLAVSLKKFNDRLE